MKHIRFISLIVLFTFVFTEFGFLIPSPAHARSNTNFYSMNSTWNNRFKYMGVVPSASPRTSVIGETPTAEPDTLVGEAAEYFKEGYQDVAQTRQIVRYVPPRLELPVESLKEISEILELEQGQILTIRGSFQRYLATREGVVEFLASGSDFLQVKGTGIGTTFIHLWDETGRITRQVRVKTAPLIDPEVRRQRLEVLEAADNFEISYDQDRSALYTGNGLRAMNRDSLFFTQNFGFRGDTPYGYWDSHILLRENTEGEQKYSELTMNLLDAKIRDFKNLDLHAGDHLVRGGRLTLPSVRLRGTSMEHEAESGRTGFSGFFGRELGGFTGALSPETEGVTKDSFIGGVNYEFKVSDHWNWELSYAQAYGQSREETLKSSAVEWYQQFRFGRFLIESDIGFDSERFAYTLLGRFNHDIWAIEAKYRQYEKDFTTIVGNSGNEGEQGLAFKISGKVWDQVEINYDGDIFLDGLAFAAGEEDRLNINQDLEALYAPDEFSEWKLGFASDDETGRASSFRNKAFKTQYRRRFEWRDRNYNFFTRLETRDFESISNPDISYRLNLLGMSLQARLPWDILFSVEPTFQRLEVPEIREVTHPRSVVYSLSQDIQIGKTPVSADWSVRFRDEEETESVRSFLTGEDRLEISGGLSYRTRDKEFFVEAKYDHIEGEGLTVESARSEAEIITGIRYFFDTGIRWESSGRFEGYVFNDVNNNGVKDASETGLPGLMIYIGGADMITDESGYYQSPLIYGKKATVILDDRNLPRGFTGSTSQRVSVDILSGVTQEVNFGLLTQSMITGSVFNDLNLNGRFDTEDEGLGGIGILLDDRDVSKSDDMGRFRFPDISLGSHSLQLDIMSLPLGYLPSGDYKREIELYEGMRYRVVFPLRAERVISGRVFHDANRNGHFDSDEIPVAGVVVQLGDFTARSDEEGYYLFDSIPKGDFVLSVNTDLTPLYRSEFFKEISLTAKPYSKTIAIPLLDRE